MMRRILDARWLGLFLGLVLSSARAPAASETVCEGLPSSGVLHNGRPLEPRSYLRIKRGSEKARWGHPVLLQLVSRGARAAALAVPGSVALVGDLSALQGGLLPGHVSHQAGRDADVAFFVSDAQGHPVELEAFEAFGGSGRSLSNGGHFFDAYRNWLMLREWLTELRVVVSHVFVSAELRQLLLDYGRASPEFARYTALAVQVLHAHPTHADHFHLRIACPSDQGAAWIQNPPDRDGPTRASTCRGVLQSLASTCGPFFAAAQDTARLGTLMPCGCRLSAFPASRWSNPSEKARRHAEERRISLIRSNEPQAGGQTKETTMNTKAKILKNAATTPDTDDSAASESSRSSKQMKQIVAAVTRGEGEERQTYWTRIGTAFENRDGSWNQLYDFFPTDPRTTIQLRDIEPRERVPRD